LTAPQQTFKPFDAVEARRRCLKFRKRILDMSQTVTALHIGGSFSCLEIVDTIYFGLMRHAGDTPNPDSFILSKGHGSLAQYVCLEELGIITANDMDMYGKPGGLLGTHPDLGTPGVDATSGSLGHGLAIAMGMALADKTRGIDRTIYICMSDGELMEGSVWEAMVLAPSLGLNNIVAFIDLNDMQSLGHTNETHPNFYPVVDKVEAFGWEAAEADGHDGEAIFQAVANRKGGAPLMVIGKTVKGKGVSYMENVPIWHYRSPDADEYQQALAELERNAR